MGSAAAELDAPQRSRLGHLWRSVLAGAMSGAVVAVVGAAVDPIRQEQGGVALGELVGVVAMPAAFAAVVGAIVGILAGLKTMSKRERFDANLRQRTAKTLALVVAVPGGVLLFPFWSVSTASTVLFVSAMLGSVLYVGVGTFLTAKVSLHFVLGD